MDIIELEFESWNILSLKLNWLAIIIAMGLIVAVSILIKHIANFAGRKSISVDAISLGIGNSSIKVSYNKKDQEIAYKLWVELTTRKIGMPIDEEHDVIKEVYDSWYEFFKITRELLKELPANKISYSKELIDLTQNVLNNGLRPHLTKWQAKYRKWYDNAIKTENSKTPQEIQHEYVLYDELLEDLIETNKRMIQYKELMYSIAFDK